ncbi:YdcF family protein [Candidatus Nomurabacteria bacterium]|nr:YdcF family protein [Candidatus Nomurabacteria bacterium]
MTNSIADAISLLGRVDTTGSLTKDALERIRYAAFLYNEGYSKFVVCHAKWSYKLKSQPEETEAVLLKNALLKYGVPAQAILLEEDSCDTLGSAYFLKINFAIPRRWDKFIVITSADHLARTRYIFNLIFGEDALLDFMCGRKVMGEDEFRSSCEREAKSLKLMQTTWFRSVVPGDHIEIAKIMEMHPGYNPDAKLSPQEMELLVQSQES